MWSASCYRKKYTLEELCDDSIDATHFISPQGQKPTHFNEMFLDDGALVPKESIKLGKLDEEERSEATGNEGVSVERWYKWTTLILWPLKRRLINIGGDKMTFKLKAAVIERTTPLGSSEKNESLELARDLVRSDGHTSDWAKNVTVACNKSCNDCKLLQEFLRDPAKNQIRFRMNQVRRQHMERQVTLLKCGTTHFTERTGSPQTLVVNKVRQPQERK